MIFLVIAEMLPALFGCIVFCGSGPDHFVAFFFLGTVILGLDVFLHK